MSGSNLTIDFDILQRFKREYLGTESIDEKADIAAKHGLFTSETAKQILLEWGEMLGSRILANAVIDTRTGLSFESSVQKSLRGIARMTSRRKFLSLFAGAIAAPVAVVEAVAGGSDVSAIDSACRIPTVFNQERPEMPDDPWCYDHAKRPKPRITLGKGKMTIAGTNFSMIFSGMNVYVS